MVTSMYIHIPFCKTICSYCDFCKMFYDSKFVKKYLQSLSKEIQVSYQKESLATLYIGGGTPSCLTLEDLEILFETVDQVKLQEEYEFTFECNIDDLTSEKLLFLKKHRVNRLSIGVETVQERFLSFLKRSSSEIEVKEKIELAKEIGFSNINVDFMYAFPNETLSDVKHDLNFFLLLQVPHISFYSLIIEDHTYLSLQEVKEIDQDLDATMYHLIEETLEKKGYVHYETSNYAYPHFESQHNLVYWNNDEYYGFGLGASGYMKSLRYTNTRSLTHYNKGCYRLEEEEISKKENMSYEMILGLRKMEGVSLSKFQTKFGVSLLQEYDIMDLLENGFLVIEGDYIKIPKDKIYVANEVLVRFV